MRIEVSAPDFSKIASGIQGDIAKAATAAMQETTPVTKQVLRDQVTSNGLGARLANTWRGNVYPKSGESLQPAGYIYSNAPEIIDSFVRGAIIVPISGSKYLAIPTKNVPRRGGRRGSTALMTPAEVEVQFNQDLFFKRGRNGHVLAFVSATPARSGRGNRVLTKGRRAQGRQAKPILMFVLVPSVRMPKLLDLEGPAKSWAADFEAAFSRELGTT